MEDTYYRLKYYIGDKLQLSYDLDYYDMATDSILTSSILNERVMDYNIPKNISKNDISFYKSYIDILYLYIYKSVERYENVDNIVSKI